MATRKPKPTVALSHPSGNFTVHVSPARAVILEERGYRRTEAKPAARGKAKAEPEPEA